MKKERQKIILDIIQKSEIETQDQLQIALSNVGVSTTQATLSRDIRDLKLIKRATDSGKSVYAVGAEVKINDDSLDRLMKIFKESVKSYDIAQNIFVLKTLPGLAPAACSALDNMTMSSLVGTIAGDDTAFLLFRDNNSAEAFLDEINTFFKR